MPQQLIYTSAPRGVVPGRSGYCTVACSRGMRQAVMLRLEQLSYFSQLSLTGDPGRPVLAYRTVDIRGAPLHLLSRIQDAGLDSTGRTNFIAHHLVLMPEETRQLPTPAIILRDWPGWVTSWRNEPGLLEGEDWGNLMALAAARCLPAKTWEQLTGSAVNGYALLDSRARALNADGINDRDLLSLIAESSELLELRDRKRGYQVAAWQQAFSTSLQEQDNPADFRWRFMDQRNPVAGRFAAEDCPSVISLRTGRTTEEEAVFATNGWRAPSNVRVTPESCSIAEGESIRLEATADGVPYPSFQWFEEEQGTRTALLGKTGPMLEDMPTGRARRYIVQAFNRADKKDSAVVSVSIREPVRLAARDSNRQRPGAARHGKKVVSARDWSVVDETNPAASEYLSTTKYLAIIAGLILLATLAIVLWNPRVRARLAGVRKGGIRLSSVSRLSAGGGAGATNTEPMQSGIDPKVPISEERADALGLSNSSRSEAQADRGSAHLVDEPFPPPPPPWIGTSVGPNPVNGGVTSTNSGFKVWAGGKRLHDLPDSFYFVHYITANPMEVSARLVESEKRAPSSLCGIMLRVSLEPDAPFAFIGASSDFIFFIHRDIKGERCQQAPHETPNWPVSLRLTCTNGIRGEYFCGNTGWKLLGTSQMPCSTQTCLFGLAVISGTTNSVIARFDNISPPPKERP